MDMVRLMLLVIVGGGLLFVVLPIAANVYVRFRRPRLVRCPERGAGARVQLDAWHAAATAIPGPPGEHVVSCSLWSGSADCSQGCLLHATSR